MPNLSEMTTTTPAPDEALEYARRLYSSVRNWYETADRKAQLVPTLDGVFVTFVSTSLAAKATELSQAISTFGPETWVLLGVALASLVLSLFSCLVCLVSRHTEANTSFLRLLFQDLTADPNPTEPGQLDTGPENLWYYELILKIGKSAFLEAAGAATSDLETKVLLRQVWRLGGIVRGKYIWVNRAFSFTALTLVFSAFAATSYIVRLAA
jgi:hypothetical protein